MCHPQFATNQPQSGRVTVSTSLPEISQVLNVTSHVIQPQVSVTFQGLCACTRGPQVVCFQTHGTAQENKENVLDPKVKPFYSSQGFLIS